jgi:hypothetical protein
MMRENITVGYGGERKRYFLMHRSFDGVYVVSSDACIARSFVDASLVLLWSLSCV